ncbi:MAG TPA: hypothetical protein VEK15_00600 [Vicinamibacteria bacterium]|nr:hypothetical protein [Vicinamibacteria bacterium]
MRARWCWILFAAVLAIRCNDEPALAPSSATRLLEAGWSFGFCLGSCNGTLTVQNETLDYRVTDREGNQVLASSQGHLTAAGSAGLSTLLSDIPQPLDDVYGCPDCADAGAAYVILNRDGVSRRSIYEYPNPPAELAALDEFLKEVMDALGACQSTAQVTIEGDCSPVPR